MRPISWRWKESQKMLVGSRKLPLLSLWILVQAMTGLADDISAAEPNELPLTAETAVRFADVSEGTAALTAKDEFVKALSRFDLQSRLRTSDEVTIEAWQRFAAGEVREWNDRERKVVSDSVARLRERLGRHRLPLPKTILLIHTTGREEADAAYTRGAAIILPDKVLAYAPSQLDRLIVHELFHILSRHHAALRKELYGIIGFQTMDPISLPSSLADRKINNPDAPLIDCYIELNDGGQKYVAAPVLYASVKDYDPNRSGSLFSYLTFRLMVLEWRVDQWQPVLREGQAIVIDPKGLPAFFEKIGENTNYIIHPDEILADNFVHLIMNDKDLKTPRIVEEMARALAK